MNESPVINTPVGKLQLFIESDRLVKIQLDSQAKLCQPQTKAGRLAHSQLDAYFQSAKNQFDLPVQGQGTEFQKRVWAALRNIPMGEVKTYGELAAQLDTSARAVGNACRRNPIPIVVPCHRIVSQAGLGGFAGETGGRLTAIKRSLLAHEGITIKQNKNQD
ncbi:methylated-DNA--[protein]-cysteine S-methyltransferase [Aliikangiella coralliicola]|uniref:methylated-DNA--[protein]-cysteine S-methyltransferase n=1 Tax=Aliikangiella coralliicola TaxID=2592383 RepID=A0A545UAG5_9GAMM|nr:methylated-DNA--[protein]-cysteine S-methyltransferase [Aliikangiella coralliicola]TQV86451.1 methylated-DNA--[protein]-cysteine S-methyltransferase [Aliikangiella coralliicola]